MPGRFTQVPYAQFKTAMDEAGFARVAVENTHEVVFERAVTTRSNKSYPYKVRVLSTFDTNTLVMRDNGSDAIRVLLVPIGNDVPLKVEKRVNRAGTATGIVDRTVERARQIFKYAISNEAYCPSCGGLLVLRRAPGRRAFRGCSNYPRCTHIDHDISMLA